MHSPTFWGIFPKDAARCEKYCDIAMKSEKEAKDALNLKLYVMKDGLKTHEDSLADVNKLKDIFANILHTIEAYRHGSTLQRQDTEKSVCHVPR